MIKVCPVSTCEEPIHDPKYVMCRCHWQLVPLGLQQTVWRLWNAGRLRDGYEEAVASAIEQVEETVAAGESRP